MKVQGTLEDAELVVTGSPWLGRGVGLIDSALSKLFSEAEHEICMTAYSVSYAEELILPLVRAALERGVKVSITVNKISAQPNSLRVPLLELVHKFPYLNVFSFEGTVDSDMHAKLVVADRKVAIVGSSNLTRRGMQNNLELGVLFRGRIAAAVARAYDRLSSSDVVIRV